MRNKLFEENIHLVNFFFWKYNRMLVEYIGGDPEDVYQECIPNVLQGIESWMRSGRSMAIGTYIGKSIRWSLMAQLTRRKRKDGRNWIKVDKEFDEDSVSDPGFDPAYAAELRELLREVLRFVSPKERYVMVERYIKSRTLGDIGMELGISRERVRQVESKAIEKMRTRTGREANDLQRKETVSPLT